MLQKKPAPSCVNWKASQVLVFKSYKSLRETLHQFKPLLVASIRRKKKKVIDWEWTEDAGLLSGAWHFEAP